MAKTTRWRITMWSNSQQFSWWLSLQHAGKSYHLWFVLGLSDRNWRKTLSWFPRRFMFPVYAWRLVQFRRLASDWSSKGSSWHSGDKMDDDKKIGSHRIEAKLKNIPKCVSHLVFFLSSFKSPSITTFLTTLRFYDASDPKKELAHATYTNDLNSCGLLVCCVSRMEGPEEEGRKRSQRKSGLPMKAELRQQAMQRISGHSRAHLWICYRKRFF